MSVDVRDVESGASPAAESAVLPRSISVRLLTDDGVPTNPARTPGPDPGHTHQPVLVPIRMRRPQNLNLSF